MKMAIVVRRDLRMGKGKLAVQIAHAAVEAYRRAQKRNPEKVKKWLAEGGKKVAVWVDDLEQLLALHQKVAISKSPLIRDAGLTQLPPGTITCFAIGPDEDEKVDRYTRGLKLI